MASTGEVTGHGPRRPTAPWSWAPTALVVLVPLAVDPAGLAPFHAPKWFLVAALVPAGLGISLLAGRSLRWPAWRWWLAWLGVSALAALTGVAPRLSLAGSPQRDFGLLAACLGAGAFVLGASVGDDAATQRRVLRGAFLAAAVVGVLAILERLDVDVFGLGDLATATRARASWGSATFAAGHLVLVGPLAVAHLRARDPRWRAIAAASTVVIAAGLVLTGTRGAWLGGVAAALVLAPAWRRTAPTSSPVGRTIAGVRPVAALGLAFAAVVALALMVPNATRASGVGRLDQWRTALPVIADRPLLGSGPDTQRIVLPSGIDASFEQAHGSKELHDRAHDLVLDTWVTTGLVGVVLLGGLLVAIARLVVGRLGDALVARAVAAGLVAYLVHLLFAFGEATLDPIAWLLAGMLVATVAQSSRPEVEVERSQNGCPDGHQAGADVAPGPSARAAAAGRRAAGAGLLVLAVVGAGWAGGEVVAERRLQRAVDQRAEGNGFAARATLERAASVAPARFDIWQLRARIGEELLGTGTPAFLQGQAPDLADPAQRSALASSALRDVRRTLAVAPGDPDLLLDRAEVLAAARRDAAARRAFASVIDGPYPRSARAHLGLGNVLAELGDRPGAFAAWRRAATLAPDDPRPLVNLGIAELQIGRTDAAVAHFRAALRRDPASAVARDALTRAGEDPGPMPPG